jgi:ubiquinol-cytochrome c reductase cytochrome c1 subunit
MNFTTMKKGLCLLLLACVPGLAPASSDVPPFSFKPDLGNEASLQRGAAAFVNYCTGCHSLKYVRYNRLAQDLGIPEDLVMKYLAPGSAKPGDTIQTTLPADKSAVWFGRTPPDLTLTARARGTDWLYSYFLTFYVDASKPSGVNNLMLPGLSMPHVLGGLQGYQKLLEPKEGEHGGGHGKGPQFELVQKGSMSEKEYREFVGDLTNFMVYAAEPVKLKRYGLGVKVLLYLLLFTAVAYLLKREYWKDVH